MSLKESHNTELGFRKCEQQAEVRENGATGNSAFIAGLWRYIRNAGKDIIYLLPVYPVGA